MRLYTHPACLDHDTGPGHVECPDRLRRVVDALKRAFPDAEWCDAPRALREDLMRVHSGESIARVLDRHPQAPREHLDTDTLLSPGSLEAALRAAGAGIGAVDWVLEGHRARAFCAVRPPGHHAEPENAMGFCLFNNVAVAAAHALSSKLVRNIAIVDFDAHHGNGTQAIFRHDPRVLYVSSHQADIYPRTGMDHTSGGGHILNHPLPAGCNAAHFRRIWQGELLPHVAGFAPDLLLISAGFDAHRADPLAGLMLEAEDFAWLTESLLRIADTSACGRVVSMLEGGYDLDALTESALAHVRALAA
ncbi:histone deacetylase family protein [Lysobacter pythonis]|uniref:Histone deacetylase family protein n=1 Tax=Solilutibacter pythonis TaxID=2483112 RepID=A0A3M2HI84_9GAMM|nr:histone deacetylase family protein [Lysobacter pythonis]RMH88698.1 histone deacetylase family protein [Lysobacter pythonis]